MSKLSFELMLMTVFYLTNIAEFDFYISSLKQ